jgi:hypothetical protein
LYKPEFEAWNISETRFPKEGTIYDKLKFFLNYAILAPSSHNTQPWLFKIVNDTIELYADRTRALPVVDPEDRELTISCGAALSHLQIAIRHFGYAYKLDLLPMSFDKGSEDLLAHISIDNGGGDGSSSRNEPTNEEYLLFQAITKRRTNRLKFEDKEVQQSLLSRLQQSIITKQAESTTTWLHIAKEVDEKNSLADLIAEGDRIQMSDKHFRRELASWIHSNRSHSKDGVPGYAFGFSDIMSFMVLLLSELLMQVKDRLQKTEILLEARLFLLYLGLILMNQWIGLMLVLLLEICYC